MSEADRMLPSQSRLAPNGVGAVDAAARTVEVIFTTGAIVRRQRYDGWDSVPFDEDLQVSEKALDLARLRAGAPVLDSHLTGSTYQQVGVVDSARVEGGKGYAVIRFPSPGVDPAADRMAGMVNDRIIRNVSVGYVINELQIIAPKKAGDVELRIAKRWTPFEISFVTVGADPGAQVRSLEQHSLYACRIHGDSAAMDALQLMRMRMRMRQYSAA